MKNASRMAREGGFTLLELLVAVSIVAILAAIAIPQFGSMITRTSEGSTKGNLGMLRSALSIYYSDNEGHYPSEGTSASKKGKGNKHKLCSTCTTNLEALTENNRYLNEIPDARLPAHGDSSGHETLDWVDALTVNGSGDFLVTDLGGWAYQWNPSLRDWGTIVVNCSHKDTRDHVWFSE